MRADLARTAKARPCTLAATRRRCQGAAMFTDGKSTIEHDHQLRGGDDEQGDAGTATAGRAPAGSLTRCRRGPSARRSGLPAGSVCCGLCTRWWGHPPAAHRETCDPRCLPRSSGSHDAPEFVGGPLPASGIARPDKHGVADLQQPACRLPPKTLVRAGDQGNGHGPKYHRPAEPGSARPPAREGSAVVAVQQRWQQLAPGDDQATDRAGSTGTLRQ